MLAIAAGWLVADTFHMSDARPEKMDGTHFGNDTDRSNMQGRPLMSRTALNLLLGGLCGGGGGGAPHSQHAQVTWSVKLN
jgi:hypothetical protein